MLMCLAIWGMLAITIYCLAPKKWGIMRVGAYLIVANVVGGGNDILSERCLLFVR